MSSLLEDMSNLLLTVLDPQGVLHHLVESVTLRLRQAAHQHREVHATVSHHGHAFQGFLDEEELVRAVQSRIIQCDISTEILIVRIMITGVIIIVAVLILGFNTFQSFLLVLEFELKDTLVDLIVRIIVVVLVILIFEIVLAILLLIL
jgi:hypothetical protein